MSSDVIRSWRTGFLTLRDEMLAEPSPAAVIQLLEELIFSQSDDLIAAAPKLPAHEVTSDIILLMEMAGNVSLEGTEELIHSFVKISGLIHSICHCSTLQINSTSWPLVLNSFGRILQIFLGKDKEQSSLIGQVSIIKATRQCVESLRCLFDRYQGAASLLENEQVLHFILHVVQLFHEEPVYSLCLSGSGNVCTDSWQVLAAAFSFIGDLYPRVGSSLKISAWLSTFEVLRKVMDSLASKNSLVENTTAAMFYVELLRCLHLVLTEPRQHLNDHVAAFVAALRIFLCYGLTSNSLINLKTSIHKKESGPTNRIPQLEASSKSKSERYRPPHLRNKVVIQRQHKDEETPVSSEHEVGSSDSEFSDNDGSMDDYGTHFAKARLAAISCIQDLCRADPKLFTSQWTMLLPSSDVLQHRKHEMTLMSCLLFDPYSKVRIAAGTTIMAMLDGPASVSLQVAELRGRSKSGSFTSLSSSLGHILMQLHSGTLHLIKHEKHGRLLALSFKILMLLMSSTPYPRMSEDLLWMVISSVRFTIDDGFPFQREQNSLLAISISCLTLALSVSPSSKHVNDMLLDEILKGNLENKWKSGVLDTLFRYARQLSATSTSTEAFQALKALAHNYPNVIAICWEQISSIVHKVLSSFSDIRARSGRVNVDAAVISMEERLVTAAIKVLDESLRAISGFRGTEDLSADNIFDSPFTSDYVKTKAISSAPSFSLANTVSAKDEAESHILASERWLEATTRHMPMIHKHSSAMVRAAAVTCFAGMTSSVLSLLPKDKQEFIISASIDAAIKDEVPSVRSAACRAIGVISCFPQIYLSTEILEKLIHAVRNNSVDSLVSVRITASWALANICDSVSHATDALHNGEDSIESRRFYQCIQSLVDSALQLAKDNDKVKANAVRALGNLSRSIQFSSLPLECDNPVNSMIFNLHYDGAKALNGDQNERSNYSQPASSGSSGSLERMVEVLLSCAETGNVKVQWNVCHALGNLFCNKTMNLQDKPWAASVFTTLLLLLRDSPNFKIRIQAAYALAVPHTINDYGRSYSDVIEGVELVLENFKSDQISEPSNFKYMIALEKQLTSTMLHLLSLASKTRCDHQNVQNFLINKASFLEMWIKDLCLSLGDNAGTSLDMAKHVASIDQKRDILLRTVKSLTEVYESCNNCIIAQRFDEIVKSML